MPKRANCEFYKFYCFINNQSFDQCGSVVPHQLEPFLKPRTDGALECSHMVTIFSCRLELEPNGGSRVLRRSPFRSSFSLPFSSTKNVSWSADHRKMRLDRLLSSTANHAYVVRTFCRDKMNISGHFRKLSGKCPVSERNFEHCSTYRYFTYAVDECVQTVSTCSR